MWGGWRRLGEKEDGVGGNGGEGGGCGVGEFGGVGDNFLNVVKV